MFDFDRILELTIASDASDLILKVGSPPAIKVSGKVLFLSESLFESADAEKVKERITTPEVRERFEKNGEVDFSLDGGPRKVRFRCNIFRQGGQIGLVLRQIKASIPSFADLHLPVTQFSHFANLSRGLVFVTGQTGSGKSTSLASIVNSIINTRNKHVVTLEDPIEYQFQDNLSIVNQREIGNDTRSFSSGLRAAMREAPDVIMVGEIRDPETMEAAIAAAETGHLVFATLHTVNAIQTVERITTFFPPHQHELVRLQLSTVLAGIASQRLLPSLKTSGMVPAVEVLMATPRIRELLYLGKTLEIGKALIEGAEYYGTQTFNMSLRSLYEGGFVSLDDALSASDNPDDLKLSLRGIQSGSGAGRFTT